MRMRYLLCMILSFAALSGCDANLFEDLAKTDTPEAKLEEARIAIDDGNYNKAVSILSESCGFDPKKPAVPPGGFKCDKETQALLSSALMGAAGLDVIKLLDLASDLAKNPNPTLDFTTLSQLLPKQSPDSITDMYGAVTLLSSIPASQRSADQNLQLAMASASTLILTVGAISCPTGAPPGDPKCGYDPATGLPIRDYTTNPLTEAELNQPASKTIGVPTNSTVGDLLITSTTTIGDAAGAAVETGADAAKRTDTTLGTTTDITKQIDDIEKTMDKNSDKKIDNKEMADYINKNLVK